MTKYSGQVKGASRKTKDKKNKPFKSQLSTNENQAKISISMWLHNHKAAFSRALFHLTHNRFASIITVLVIASTLTLPASFQVVFSSLQGKEEKLARHGGVSVFLSQNISQNTLEQLKTQLQNKPEIRDLTYLSASNALSEFQKSIGVNTDNLLSNNPLPPVIYLTLDMETSTAEKIQQLEQWISNLDSVELVQVDSQWIEQLYAIVNLVKNISILFALFLIFTVMVIIGNTIRLLAQHYYDEILVSKLMGATDAYVRRPFLYSGLLFGLLGGIFACTFVALGLLWLSPEIAAMMPNSNDRLSINGLNFADIASILVIGLSLGIGGAWIASNRIINEISL